MFTSRVADACEDNAPIAWKPATEWERKLKEITWSFGNDDVRFRHEQWRRVFEKQLESTPLSIQGADPLFSLPLGEESVAFTQWLTPDDIWHRYYSKQLFSAVSCPHSSLKRL